MIHFSCDRCRCVIDAELEVRYVIRIEVQAAVEPPDTKDENTEHLSELQELMDRMEPDEFEALQKRAYHEHKFDLCEECYRKYEKNPLGIEAAKSVGFSDN